jgi:polyisoprenoid-binding protein YceI
MSIDTTASTTSRTTNLPSPGTYTIDLSHTHVGFAVKHFGLSKVRGEFTSVEGTVVIAENVSDSSVTATINTASFNSRDEARDTHVRSSDFLDVDNFPTITFASTSVSVADDGDWVVHGDLTIKGVTRQVALATEFEGAITDPYSLERIAFSAETEIDRTDFGLDFNAVVDSGGLVVGKKVKITLEVQAVAPQD